MSKPVPEYIMARDNLFRFFGCPDAYPIRTATNAEWAIREDSGICFLTLFEGERRADFVVAQKDDEALVFKTKEYTMAVAIDCIKTAFVLKNANAK